jgi:hypothetical protein
MLLWVRARSGDTPLTDCVEPDFRRYDSFASPVDRKLEFAMPVALLHYEEQGGLGAELDEEADHKGT